MSRTSSGRSPSGQPEFFVDRSLGRFVVPQALTAAGHVVHTMHAVYGEREQFIEDTEWLDLAGRSAWIVLTKDESIRRSAPELEVVADHRLRIFTLVRAGLRAAEQADLFVRNIDRIVRASAEPGPYVYGVYRGRIRKLWPA